MPATTYYLRKVGLLRDLPESAAEALAQRMRTRFFTRRQTIFTQGAPAAEIHLLVEGTVELSRAAGGKETILLVLSPGEFIDAPREDPASGYPVQARALEDCVVCSIGRGELEALALAYPALAWRLLTWMNRGTLQGYARIHALASCEVPDKLLALLKQLAERHGVPTNEGMEIGVRLTQNELAALIGSCREAVSRGLKLLRERGLIRVRAHTITLLASA